MAKAIKPFCIFENSLHPFFLTGHFSHYSSMKCPLWCWSELRKLSRPTGDASKCRCNIPCSWWSCSWTKGKVGRPWDRKGSIGLWRIRYGWLSRAMVSQGRWVALRSTLRTELQTWDNSLWHNASPVGRQLPSTLLPQHSFHPKRLSSITWDRSASRPSVLNPVKTFLRRAKHRVITQCLKRWTQWISNRWSLIQLTRLLKKMRVRLSEQLLHQ